VAFYYPQLYVTNAANGLQRVAPGMIASIYPAGNTYGSQTMNYLDLPNPVPLATTMGDIQVRVNDVPAPLFFVSPGQINFQVPSSAPVSGTADFQVIRPSTGQVLADIPVTMDLASPGFFTDGNLTYGQASSLNQDNTRNSATNAIPRTQVIQLFLTGAGIVPNMPPDGTLPGAAFRTSINPRVVIGTTFVPDANIQYSGLAPGLVGVWQINVLVPDITSGVGSSVAIGVQYQDRSSLGYLGKPVTIAVK
jgi:uncharacterized protein (TIGR03437 family)